MNYNQGGGVKGFNISLILLLTCILTSQVHHFIFMRGKND